MPDRRRGREQGAAGPLRRIHLAWGGVAASRRRRILLPARRLLFVAWWHDADAWVRRDGAIPSPMDKAPYA
ncbi:hypothetical protein GCM10023332_03520 [Luteimonas vadosa]|uniref:Uncharacterized protein n=1 Tax=Luteimonas vadosa TaxID=1165507 RepID=A0ABP9DQE5_9GAMM